MRTRDIQLTELETCTSTDQIFSDIRAERRRQDETWGPQRHDWPIWSAILTEEAGEVAEACLRVHFGHDASLDHLREELIQVAAVAVHMVEHIDELTGEEE
jgi:NTP pyrophosphatase (non-canonical NTP hydrolase)